jgi:hypothetical protein
LTAAPWCGNLPAMADEAARKKHRHDLGQEDHGPKYAAQTTRAIQVLLGLWIALTFALVVYALVDASRPKKPNAAPGTPTSTPHVE